MKYKLKKDLPFVKAGNEVEIINGEPIFFKDGFHCDYSSIDDLLADGWIEEIRPREFTVQLVNGRLFDCTTPPIEHGDRVEYTEVKEVLK